MRLGFLFFLLSACLIPSFAVAQSGCTDSLAQNFDASAQTNDGSCIYPPATFNLQPVSILPETLQEISGITLGNEKWWAHNDSEDAAVFYRIQPENGQIVQNVTLDAADNKDWEEMCSTPVNLLIGDFGNNNNDRLDLGIYSVPFNEIGAENETIVPESSWTFIPFSFPDQADFNTVPRDSTTHDCEAMFWRNGKIHLLTKNWKTYQTSHYTLDPVTGTTVLLENFDTGGLVTGAAISPDSQLVALICYDIKNQYSAFAWLLWDWPDPESEFIFTGNKRRIDFGSLLFNGQVEGIAFSGKRSGYISNERSIAGGIVFAGQAIKSFDFSEWVPEEDSSPTSVIPAENLWQVYPTLFSDRIYVHAQIPDTSGRIMIYNLNGAVVFSTSTGGSLAIDTSNWSPGMYVINCGSDAGCFAAKLFKIK